MQHELQNCYNTRCNKFSNLFISGLQTQLLTTHFLFILILSFYNTDCWINWHTVNVEHYIHVGADN